MQLRTLGRLSAIGTVGGSITTHDSRIRMRTSLPPPTNRGPGHDPSARFTNHLFAALPDRESLAPLLERTELQQDETIYEAGASITHYLFPVRGIISVVKEAAHGAMEVGAAGVEGMVGISALLAIPISTGRIFAQTAVVADRLGVDALNAHFEASADARDLLLRYVHAVHEEACQSILCARFHALEERCARMLLVAHDRVGRNDIPLKQEFLAHMLGVHRPAVSIAAGALQKERLIHYHRGHIEVLDRPGLEQMACECYAATQATYRRARLPWGASAT
jgi:CRP-like cAMP-binding protein